MCHIKPVRTEAEYEAALDRIYAIWDAEPGTPEDAELELLVDLVELYEARHYPIGKPSLADAVEFQMEQRGLTVPQLNELLGGQADVDALLAGKQPLTLALATALHEQLGISEAVLLKSTHLHKQQSVSESTMGFPIG